MLEVNKYYAGKNSNLGRWGRRVGIQYNTIATSGLTGRDRKGPISAGKPREVAIVYNISPFC